jgi:hypothetical protein
MEINEVIKEHDVVDYNFMFPTGSKLTVTVDLTLNESAVEMADRFVVNTVNKPNFSNPEEIIEAEEIVVFKSGLAAVTTCKRKQRQPTEEELFDMRKLMHEIAKQTM